MTDRKERILQTALHLFSEMGYDNTPTSLIAKEAEVSEGLIFRHFASKEGLMDALLDRGNERVGVHIQAILDITDPRKRLEKTIDLPVSLLHTEKSSWSILFTLRWQKSYRKAADREIKYILPLQQALVTAFTQLKFPNPRQEVALLFVALEGLSNLLLTQPYTQEVAGTIQLLKSKYYT